MGVTQQLGSEQIADNHVEAMKAHKNTLHHPRSHEAYYRWFDQ